MQRGEILSQLEQGGAIWFRGFELMKTKEGFQTFYEQMQLSPCQDPLASVGARAVVKGAEISLAWPSSSPADDAASASPQTTRLTRRPSRRQRKRR